jgi:hypothetical protein
MADDRDDWIREALARTPLPPESDTFFDDLWEAAQARERAAVRRWRRVSLALAVVTAAAVSSAAVLAASPTSASASVDLTGVCFAQEQGGIPAFIVGAIVSGARRPGVSPTAKPPPGYHVDPTIWITTTAGLVPNEAPVFSLNFQFSGYQLDRRACPPTPMKVEFSREGLPNAVHLGVKNLQLVRRCLGPVRFAFRIHVVTDRNGVPIRAQIAAANARTGKRLVYIVWSPKRVDGWSAPSCE